MNFNEFSKIVSRYYYRNGVKTLPFVLAVDFDDTLCDGNNNEIKPICDFIRQVNRDLPTAVTIILTTCRGGYTLDNAIDWLDKHNIKIDYFNENSPLHIEGWHDCRKIFCHMLIDNTSYNFDINDFV